MIDHKTKIIIPIGALIFFIASCKVQNTSSANNSILKDSTITVKTIEPQPTKKHFIFPQIHAHLNGMVSEFIFKIYQDKDSVFWFCTNHDGIIKYDGEKLRKYSKEQGVGGNAVRSFVVDNEGLLWFGTSGGLTKYDGEQFVNFTFGEDEWECEIWCLAIDKAGLIWIGANSGVWTFDGTNFEQFNVPKPKIEAVNSMISEERVSSILIDQKEHFWFVNDGCGITQYDGESFTFLTTKNGLTDNSVAAVFEDSRGDIWIGTYYGGVSRIHKENFTNYTKDKVIEGVETYNFCEDQAGNVWFSAEGFGVYQFDGKVFTNYSTKNGLTSDVVQHIFEDKKGQIWFCTWQGISLFDGHSIMDAGQKEPWTK